MARDSKDERTIGQHQRRPPRQRTLCKLVGRKEEERGCASAEHEGSPEAPENSGFVCRIFFPFFDGRGRKPKTEIGS